MRKLLNTLYVTTQGSYLSKEGEAILVNVEREVKLRLPIHTLQSIVCFGNVACSPFLLGHCAENSVGVCFLTENGRFLARLQGPVSGNVLLRRTQYRWADDPVQSAAIASVVVAAKVANSRMVLHRFIRDHGGTDAVRQAVDRLEKIVDAARKAASVDEARGIEGDAGRTYFSVFDHLIVAQKDGFSFAERNRRPPLDPVNAMLSFVYTLLAHDVESALESVGLDPAVGFLHRDRPGRPSLALDLMEELRPHLADRMVLSMINLQKIKARAFRKTESGAVLMDDDSRKQMLVSYQERKREEITHPFLDEKIPVGLVPYVQALLLARHVRGDLDAYPPFIWK